MTTTSTTPPEELARSGTLAALLLALALGFTASPVIAADAEQTPEEEMAEKEAKAFKKLAKKLYKNARDATRKHNMHGLAVGMFRQVILWDPDHEDAREALGFEEVDGRWVRRPEISVEVLNREDEFVDPDTHKRKHYIRIKKGAEKFCEDAAEEFEDLAKDAEKLGLSDKADEYWRHVLLFDIDNEEVRQKLGYVQVDSGLWVPQRVFDQLAYTEELKEFRDDSFMNVVKAELKGARTEHGCLIVPSAAQQPAIQALADAGERTVRVFQQLFKLSDADFNATVHYHYVMPTRDLYKAVVDASPISDPHMKQVIRDDHGVCRSCTLPPYRPSGVTWVRSGDVDSTASFFAHQFAEDLTHANLGNLSTWISETIANLCEEIVTNATVLSCVASRTDTERPTVRKEGSEKKRRKACTDMVMEGLDRPLVRAIAAVGSNEIEGSGIMKCTGVFTMLYTLDEDQFIEFVRASVNKTGEPQKEIFRDTFGREIVEWDNWWKYLVLGTYLKK